MERTLAEKIIDAHGSSDVPQELVRIGRGRICCFTGHRPDQLPDLGDPGGAGMKELRNRTETYIRMLMLSGKNVFIIGMSRGYDLLAADILTDTPDIADNITLICALPYMQQLKEMRTEAERGIYIKALVKARYAVKLFDGYEEGCYRIRNQFMVNCSSALIGYLKCPGLKRSGSAQTYRMAKREGLDTIIIYENDIDNGMKG